jgi:uncharacterized protein (DUF305 family)
MNQSNTSLARWGVTVLVTASVAALAYFGLPRHASPSESSVRADDVCDVSGEQPFLNRNEAAVKEMMADVGAAATGDVDRDYVAVMTLHHTEAIEMALTFLRYGKNEQIKKLAREDILTLEGEVSAMRRSID